jgi:hypothetical protein
MLDGGLLLRGGLLLGVRRLVTPLVRRELALRAVEDPGAVELGLCLGGRPTEPEQEHGHQADRML